jgi:hypothetical protein
VAARALLLAGTALVVVGVVGFVIPGLGAILTFAVPGGLLLLAIAVGVLVLGRTAGEGLGRTLGALYGGSGASTPARKGYSAIEALEARGAYTDAAAAYRAEIARDPADWEARVRLAELMLRHLDDPRAAVDLYREARTRVADEGRRIGLTLRLVDLYRDALHDRGRAVVELRRLIDTHPRSPHVAGARVELARLLAAGPPPGEP